MPVEVSRLGEVGSRVPSSQWLAQGPFFCPSPSGPSSDRLFSFSLMSSTTFMCLDDVLGFINPETQMPNTVLLAGVGWGRVSEEGAEAPQWLRIWGERRMGPHPGTASISLQRQALSPSSQIVIRVQGQAEL